MVVEDSDSYLCLGAGRAEFRAADIEAIVGDGVDVVGVGLVGEDGQRVGK